MYILKRSPELEFIQAGGRTKDLGLSWKAKRWVKAIRQECYWNARRAIILECLPGNPRYVEGVAVMNIAPITFEHGWVELDDGTIVDPTLTDPGFKYFGAYSYDRDQALDHELGHPGVGAIWTVLFGVYGVYGELDYQKAHIRAQLAAGYPPAMVMYQGRRMEAAVMLVFQEAGIDFDQAAMIEDFIKTGTTQPVKLKKGVKE